MDRKQLNTDSKHPERASPKRLAFSMSSNGTSGQVGPKQSKKPHRVFRQESAQEPPSERLHQGADSSGYQVRMESNTSALYTEKAGAANRKAGTKSRPSKRARMTKPVAAMTGTQVKSVIHSRISEAERENMGVEAAHRTGIAGERAVNETSRLLKNRLRSHSSRSVRIQGNTARANENAAQVKGFAQKQRWKRRGQKKARQAAQAARTAQKTAVTTEKTANFVVRHPLLTLILALLLLITGLLLSGMAGAATLGSGLSGAVTASSYLAADAEIDKAELAYTEWETDLQLTLQNMENARPGYDEYRYDVDDVGHNPYELMAFLTAVYGDFTYAEIEDALRGIFEEQYTLTTNETVETRTETRTVQAGELIGQVRTTAYCNCAVCNGKWAGGPTSSGAMPTAGHTIAVDAKNPIVPMGTQVIINGKRYTVEDTGNLNANNSDIDIYFNTHAQALAWGRQSHAMYLSEGNSNTLTITETREYRILEVTLTARSFTNGIYFRMDEEQRERYSVLMAAKGGRQYLHSPFGEENWLPYVTAYYGFRVMDGAKDYHKGIDISMPQGTDVLAGQDGTITFAGETPEYGLTVVIEDGTLTSKYAGCSYLFVSEGQEVKAGDQVARTGPSLHLEILKDGQYLNPLFFAVTNDYGAGPAYGDPGAAMEGGSYAALIAEGEKHLGKPYVFGASGPNSFDCSGFVCYVLNHSGVKSMGRTNAQGLYNMCTPIPPSEAKPGDLIFFTGTYSTPNPVTHVAFYVGGDTMLHAGKPVQYSSFRTPYWQKHFYSFGRLPVSG